MAKRLACLVLLFCATIPVGTTGAIQASSAKPSFMMYGPTGVSCGKFTAVQGHEHELYEWWALGVVTGAGLFGGVPLAKSDADGVLGWIGKYCAEHPLDQIMRAASSLVYELQDRSRAEPKP